jgi:hypothetical protein
MAAGAEGDANLHGGTVSILPAAGGPVDLSLADTLSLWIYDEQGGNAIELRLRDAGGNISASYWSDRGAKHDKWTKLTWDLAWFEGIDKRRIQGLDLYEWSDGVYHFDDLTYTLVPQVEEFHDLDDRVFAEPFRAAAGDHSPRLRLYHGPLASVTSEVAGTEPYLGYQISYAGVTEAEYTCWAINFEQSLDASEQWTRLALDLKGAQGGELPHLWLQSCAPWGKVRNLVELEPASNNWQRVEIPLSDFHVIGGPGQTLDLACLQEMALCFEWGDMAGTVSVAGVAFESGP